MLLIALAFGLGFTCLASSVHSGAGNVFVLVSGGAVASNNSTSNYNNATNNKTTTTTTTTTIQTIALTSAAAQQITTATPIANDNQTLTNRVPIIIHIRLKQQQQPPPPSPPPPPPPPPPPVVEDKYSCPHGWTRYGSKKCLKYANELLDYERAQAVCRSKNQGTLVTIHSHEEQNFVYSYIHSIAASSTPIWLGAKQIDFESILWLDKTENTYTNWAPSEPSHPDEICIAINPRNGMWHDVMCTEANVPACERAPTTQWPFFVPFCSEGWFQFNDEKCVRIISSQALNFYESQELCRSKYNSKLLSIKSDKESEFLHNLIKFRDVKLPVWLGAVQNDFSSFNWIDKSEVTFTNWAEGEPNDPDHACLSMTASGGKWSDNDCKEQKLILCQKAVPEDSSCETGWLQFRQDKCYRFVHFRLAFDEAESLCNSLYGGHLPSIHSQEEQFMILQFLASVNVKNGSEIWLGGRQMDFHNFNWGDGSIFNYSYWDHGEPNFPAEKCIEMSWRNGRWNDISCRLKRAVLCERQVSSRHHIKPNLYQPTTCLESNCTTLAITGQTGAPGGEPSAAATDFATEQANQTSSQNGAGQREPSNNTTDFLSNRTSAEEPLDDKPIKVIASIMNREPQPTVVLPPALSMALSSSLPPPSFNDETHMATPNNGTTNGSNSTTTSTTTFIQYNLPPPGRNPSADHQSSMLADSGLQAKSQEPVAAPAATGSDSLSLNSEEKVSTPPAQQMFDSPASILDKLKLPVLPILSGGIPSTVATVSSSNSTDNLLSTSV